MLTILLTSTNLAKQEAVKVFFASINISINVIGVSVPSGVSDTPHSHEEGVQGCLNRIQEAKKTDHIYDYIVSMEGIVVLYSFGTALCGRVVIESKEGRQGIGCSGQCMLPSIVTDQLNQHKQLRDIIVDLYPESQDTLPIVGTNGFLTQGLYTRVDEFEDAMRCAWGILTHIPKI